MIPITTNKKNMQVFFGTLIKNKNAVAIFSRWNLGYYHINQKQRKNWTQGER